MRTLISLTVALMAAPTGAALSAPPSVPIQEQPSPELVAGILPDDPPPHDEIRLRSRIVSLSTRARTHAGRLGLTPPPTVHPAASPERLAAQERRLSDITMFLAHRRELDGAIDQRAALEFRPRSQGAAVLSRTHVTVSRLALRLGLDQPAEPRPAATAEGRGRQLARLRAIATWLRVRSERVRPDERPLADRLPHYDEWMCIAEHESLRTWDISTGNGYFGGLQMDRQFQRTYAPRLYRTKGTADRWTPEEQMRTAERALATRGFWPWPNTARACGLL